MSNNIKKVWEKTTKCDFSGCSNCKTCQLLRQINHQVCCNWNHLNDFINSTSQAISTENTSSLSVPTSLQNINLGSVIYSLGSQIFILPNSNNETIQLNGRGIYKVDFSTTYKGVLDNTQFTIQGAIIGSTGFISGSKITQNINVSSIKNSLSYQFLITVPTVADRVNFSMQFSGTDSNIQLSNTNVVVTRVA